MECHKALFHAAQVDKKTRVHKEWRHISANKMKDDKKIIPGVRRCILP